MSIKAKKVFFLVATEYHMLVTLSAIADRYSDPAEYDVTVWQVESASKNRFQFHKTLNIKHVTYKVIPFDEGNVAYNPNLRNEIATIETQFFNEYVFFNDHSILGVFFAKTLAPKGTHVILAPDGTKACSNITRIAPRWSLKFALKYRLFIKVHQLSVSPLHYHWPSLRYAAMREVTEVWVQAASHYKNWNSKIVTEIRVMESPAAIGLISGFFGFKAESEMVTTNKVVFLICLPPLVEQFERFNLTLIAELRKRFAEYTLMVKLHPSTTEKQVAEIEAFGNSVLIRSPFPAELYIAQLRDSIVISYWSTASLVNNPSCRFYWLHRILKKESNLLDYMNLVNPTSHIKEVESIAEIV